MADNKERYALTLPVVMSHPCLLVPRGFGVRGKETGDPKYSGNFVLGLENPDLKPISALLIKMGKAEWPAVNLGEMVKTGKLSMPIKDGSTLADARADACKLKGKEPDGEFQRGKKVLIARTKIAPKLACIINGRIVDLDTEELRKLHIGKFYFGVEALAQFTFVTHGAVGGNPPGINAWLDHVLATDKGTKLASSGPSAAETFKGYAGSYTSEDPLAGGGQVQDDEIPF